MTQSFTHKHSFLQLFKQILSIFYATRKRQFYGVLLLVFFSSLADVISFSVIIPVVYVVNNPAFIHQSVVLDKLYVLFHFTSSSAFTLFLLVGLVLIFLFKNIFLLISIYFQNKFSFAVAADIVHKQFSNFYNNDYLDIKEKNTVEYLRSFFEGPQGFADMLMMPMIFVLNELLVIIFIVIALLIYKPLVVLLLLITVAPIGYIMIFIAKKRLHENSENRTNIESKVYITVTEGINAYRDVKLSNKENVYITNILNLLNQYYKILIVKNVYILTPRRIIEFLVVATIGIIYVIAFFVLHITQAQLILVLLTFATAAYRMLPSINEVVMNIVRIRTSVYLLDLIKFVKEPEILNVELEPLSFNNKIELVNVNFSYKEKHQPILKNINLTINKGEFVVLTGDSGAGKTTIGKILTGFVRPNNGKYLLDGKEVKHISQIKRHIGYVTQDFYLFDKTLIENIAIGENVESVNMDKINQIIRQVNLEQFVESLPLGVHQPIGEMGTKISGGQRQRIAIARALYKDVDFLVLDEATSSLDNLTEQAIIDTIYEIAKTANLTVLLITHRVSSIKFPDTVYEIKNQLLHKINQN